MPLESSLAEKRRDSPAVTLADHIMVAEDVLTAAHCERLIERFEASERHQTCRLERGHSFSQLEITSAWPDEHDRLLPVFLAHFRKYEEIAGTTYWPKNIAFEHLRMKRYQPGGRDYFAPHVDVVDQLTARRFVTAMIYLNAPTGGETVFSNLDIVIAPRPGRLLAFPPLWLFPHEGRAPRDIPKYILHTYLCYGA